MGAIGDIIKRASSNEVRIEEEKDDLDYFMEKLYEASGVPKVRLKDLYTYDMIDTTSYDSYRIEGDKNDLIGKGMYDKLF